MFGFKSISISKAFASIITTIADIPAYFLMKLSGESTPGNLNTVVLDSGPSSYAVTNNGSVVVGSFSPFEQNWSVYFNGSSNMTVPSNAALTFGTGDLTVECWIFQTATSSGTYRVLIGDDLYGGAGGYTLYSYNDALNLWRGGTTAAEVIAPSGTIPLNTWTHIAWTRSGSSNRLFINGTQVGATTSDSTNYTGTSVFIGSSRLNTFNFTGYMSNVRIVKGTALYTSNFTPSTSPLSAVANTSLLTCQSATLVDNSAFNSTITAAGSPSTVAFNPFGNTEITAEPPAHSIVFAGSGNNLSIPSNSAFDLGSGNFTMECWANIGSVPCFVNRRPAGLAEGWLFAAHEFSAHIGGTWRQNAISVTAPTGRWLHVALVRNGNVFTLYHDGVSVGSYTQSGAIQDLARNLVIGVAGGTTEGPYTGSISNLRIVRGTALYTSSFTPPRNLLSAIPGTSLLVGVGNTISDLSSNAHSITVTGSPRVSALAPFSQSATTTTAAIPTNYSYSFNGSSFMSVSRDCVQFGTGNFTMEAWIYPTSSSEMNIFSRAWSGNNFLLCGINGGVISFWMGHATTGWVNPSSANTAIRTNQWQHIALTRNGTVVNIWVNGVSVASATSSVNMTNADTTPLTIGRYPFSGNPFSGFISNVRVVNGSCLYTTSFTPPSTMLRIVPGTTLLTCQGSTVVDSGPSALTITTTGTITPALVDHSYGNSYSVQFSGSGQYLSSPSDTALSFGTGDFTIECWFNSTDVSPAQRGILQTSTTAGGLATSYTTGVHFAQGSNTTGGNLAGGLIVNVGGTYIGSNTAVLTTNTWYHIAATRQAGTVRLFVNGALNASGIAAANCTGTNLAIGGAYSTSFLFAGRISNLRIVKGTALYTAAFTPSTSPLLPVTRTELLACQSNRLIDNSTNNFTLTATGTPAVSTTSPFSVTSTATFPSSSLFAGSANFTGSLSSVLQAPAASSISGAGDFTIDFWIYPTAFASGYTGLITGEATGSLALVINSTGTISEGRAYQNIADGTTTNRVVFGCWNHIVLTRRSSITYIFINGVVGLSRVSTVNYTASTMHIGRDITQGNFTGFYNGLISNFRIQQNPIYAIRNFVPSLTPLITQYTNSNTKLLLTFDSYGAIDVLGQNLPLSVTGTVSVSTAQKKNGNTSLFFNGSTSFLTLPSTPLMDIFGGPMTVEAWIYPTSASLATRSEHVASFIVNASNRASLYFNGNTFTFWTSTTAGGSGSRITTSSIPINSWTHIAVVKQANAFTMFVNGVSVGTSTTAVFPTGNQLLRIGTYDGTVAADSFTGYIDDFKIHRTTKYTSTFTPS